MKWHLIQVCYDTAQAKTLKREMDALLEASIELKCGNLLLITWTSSLLRGQNSI